MRKREKERKQKRNGQRRGEPKYSSHDGREKHAKRDIGHRGPDEERASFPNLVILLHFRFVPLWRPPTVRVVLSPGHRTGHQGVVRLYFLYYFTIVPSFSGRLRRVALMHDLHHLTKAAVSLKYGHVIYIVPIVGAVQTRVIHTSPLSCKGDAKLQYSPAHRNAASSAFPGPCTGLWPTAIFCETAILDSSVYAAAAVFRVGRTDSIDGVDGPD